MKVNLYLVFRILPDEVKSMLPAAFGQIAGSLVVDEDGTRSICDILVDTEMAEDIVTWSRTTHNGKAIVRIARFRDVYEPSDLDGRDLVEIFYRASSSVPYARISNYSKALKAHGLARAVPERM